MNMSVVFSLLGYYNLLIDLKKLGGAGLDVFPDELEVDPRLLKFDNVTLLPHMETEMKDTQKVMEVHALTNLRDFLVSGMGQDLVADNSFSDKETM